MEISKIGLIAACNDVLHTDISCQKHTPSQIPRQIWWTCLSFLQSLTMRMTARKAVPMYRCWYYARSMQDHRKAVARQLDVYRVSEHWYLEMMAEWLGRALDGDTEDSHEDSLPAHSRGWCAILVEIPGELHNPRSWSHWATSHLGQLEQAQLQYSHHILEPQATKHEYRYWS